MQTGAAKTCLISRIGGNSSRGRQRAVRSTQHDERKDRVKTKKRERKKKKEGERDTNASKKQRGKELKGATPVDAPFQTAGGERRCTPERKKHYYCAKEASVTGSVSRRPAMSAQERQEASEERSEREGQWRCAPWQALDGGLQSGFQMQQRATKSERRSQVICTW